MKIDKLFLRLNTLIFMLALAAGLIFFTCGFLGRLPKNVTVNGIDVGGKTRGKAVEIIRADIVENLKTRRLAVRGKKGEYVFSYPEIGYRDNLREILSGAVKGGEYTAEVSYYLNGLSEITAAICCDESLPVVEPYAVFNSTGEPFTYYEGSDGLKADRLKLLSDIRASLAGDFCEVKVEVKKVPRTSNMNAVKYNTRLLSTFTTQYDGGNAPRSHNIRLAAASINGTVLANGDEFSFNGTVGKRTAERGFKKANIIENGKFVEGYGGGVCQVSTTLFNAAMLAGCDMTEFHQHSLSVGYVPPSFDAMVSGDFYDLKFKNKTGYTLYIRARTTQNSVSFDVYGRGDGARYDYRSVVTDILTAPEETTSDVSLVKPGKDGAVSEGYLTVTRNGVKTTKLLRRDKYAPVKRVVLEETAEAEEGGGEGA